MRSSLSRSGSPGLVVLLAIVCAATVGGGRGARGATSLELVNKSIAHVDTIRLTRRIPAHVRKICAATRRNVRIRVVCPPLVPAGGVVTDPGLSYSDTYRNVTDFYALTFNNGEIPSKLHWVVGAGTPARVERYVLSSRYWDVKGPVQRLGNVQSAGKNVALYSFPEAPAGGIYGSHVVAMTRVGRLRFFASVHGYGQAAQRADIAMLIAMVNRRT